MRVVGFTLGGNSFGVELQMVQEIIRNSPVFTLPNAPDFIEGVINLRTSIIPLIDLRKRLQIEQSGHGHNDQSRYLVLDIQGTTACISVDSVTGIHSIEQAAPPASADLPPADIEGQYIKETRTLGETQIKILACNKILDSREQGQLETMSTDHTRTI